MRHVWSLLSLFSLWYHHTAVVTKCLYIWVQHSYKDPSPLSLAWVTHTKTRRWATQQTNTYTCSNTHSHKQMSVQCLTYTTEKYHKIINKWMHILHSYKSLCMQCVCVWHVPYTVHACILPFYLSLFFLVSE